MKYELPEPEILMTFNGWAEKWEAETLKNCMKRDEADRLIGYTADQMQAAYAAGLAAQPQQE